MNSHLIAGILHLADSSGATDLPFPTAVPGLSVMRACGPTQLRHTVLSPIICLVLQGEKQIVVGPRSVAFGRGHSVLVSLDLPGLSRITRASRAEPYVAVALDLDLMLLRELSGGLPGPVPSAEAISTAPATGEISDALGRLFALTDKPQAIPVVAPLITREIHYWLLGSAHAAMLRNLAHADSRAAGVARAIAAIRQDIATTQPVHALARLAGMSPSAFHDHFRAITGTSPLQFQKQLKLAEARRLLQGGGLSISRTAFSVGYESPSQFTRDYSRLFGTPPTRDRHVA